jgi:uncharacterized protein YlzI (FlbEa/FlbD family)
MFASFTAMNENNTVAVRINPEHVASVLEILPERTKITLSGGTDHVVAHPLDVVVHRLQEALGPVAV